MKVRVRTCRIRGILRTHQTRCGATYISRGGAVPQFVQTSCLWDVLVALEHAGIPWRGSVPCSHTPSASENLVRGDHCSPHSEARDGDFLCGCSVRIEVSRDTYSSKAGSGKLAAGSQNQGDQGVARAVRPARLLARPSATLQ